MPRNDRDRIISLKHIIPSNTIKNEFDALYIGTGGDLWVTAAGDDDMVLLKSVQAGYHAICTKYVNAGTTASNIVGCIIQ
jgi:hypothetical protein